ncbi:ferredoxin-type protein NapH [Salmonella enterica subsp. enterica]|uniref:Ferredoxin-type protein NapH n=1 Tax=Salmonella enterica I TaxID=59201 RepID=A0A447PDW9_SALET|nr:ferredoxin-type protein NapH [Salmonella enterica subsp. enterica]
MGALYGVLGSKGVVTVTAKKREKCNRCMDCFHVCPEPHVLRAPVLDEQSPAQVTHRDCMTCGRCVDVCSEDVFYNNDTQHHSGCIAAVSEEISRSIDNDVTGILERSQQRGSSKDEV